MIITEQIKMARTAIGWSINKLAEESSVSVRTIHRLEANDGIIKITPANLKLIITTLEAAGVEFVGSPGDRPGVRLRDK